ncbi:MAG: hypothetical protein DRP66_01540 [Planctomycetota bacterium]|nr:MAG: hypothetical protein DRP66_01540 [Planctomycetota bacterium]
MNNVIKVLLLVGAGLALLQASGCAVRVRGRERSFVKSERIYGSVNLTARRRTEELNSSGTSRKSESTIMQEELFLGTQGDVFDPKLMTYVAGVGLGLNQQKFKQETESGSSSGNLNSYNFGANFLSGKLYPFSVNTRKSESVSSRRFQSPLQMENTSNSFLGRLRFENWPMTFSWSKDEMTRSSDIGSAEDLYDRTDERFGYSLRHNFSERSRMYFRSDLSNLSQTGGSFTREIKTTQHRLLHDYNFGRNNQHSLNTSVSLADRTGDFENKTFNWNESLKLYHSPTFSTFYNAYVVDNTFELGESRTTGVTAGFYHQLYDNLNTSFSAFASKSDFGANSESTRRGGKLRFDYYRNNPWGLLTSRYSVRMTTRESSGATGTDLVTGESHIFDEDDPNPVTLERRNIVVDSIVVTDSTGTEIYTEGIDGDYTVREVDGRIELTVYPLDDTLPNISDGQEILVDYLVQTDASTDIENIQHDFRIEQQFNNGFSVFYSYLNRQNRFGASTGSGTVNLDDEYETNSFGAGYSNDYISLNAEHGETKSNQNSSKSDRLAASIVWPLTPKTSFRGRVSQSWLDSTGNLARETSLFRANGGIKTRLTRYLKLSGDVELRKEDSSDIGPTDGWKLGAALQYNRRSLSVRAGLDYYTLQRRDTERAGTIFYLRLTRRF